MSGDDQYTRTREASSSGPRALTYRRCRIVVTEGPETGRQLETERDLIRIGSHGDNDLVIPDPAVSRHHLEVHKREGEYVIVDNGSTNGTFVGSLRVKEAVIRRRGEIHIGDSSLLFEPMETELVVEPSVAERCEDLVGRSVPMREIYTVVERVASTDLTILVTGETGTGKELVARALHAKSRRSGGPFVTLDCSALPPTLIESALFGHERGALTGSGETYPGAFERAQNGTLFLDEVADLPDELQPKVLRALERGEIQRQRGDRIIRVDVRVVAATKRDLQQQMRASKFRDDLYYRLAVIRLALPALRDRTEDIPLIIEDFFQRHGLELSETGVAARHVGPGAMAALTRHPFMGNVRELINVIRRAAVFASGEEITVADLPDDIARDGTAEPAAEIGATMPMPDASVPFKAAKATVVDAFERQYLQDLLSRHEHNISKAAREAGIDRRHLYRLLDKYEIDIKDRED